MKIAFVSQPWDEVVLPLEAGSSLAIVGSELCKRLARSHEVVMYAPRGWGQSKQEVSDSGLRVRRVSGAARVPHQLLERFSGFFDARRPYFTTTRYFRSYIRRVMRDLSQSPPDIVHLMSFAQYLPLLRAAVPNAKLVLHMHGESLTQLDPDLVSCHIRHADLIVSCSDYLTHLIRDHFPRHAARCHTVYNGVDASHFHPERAFDGAGARPTRILYAGRVSPEKGIHVLTEAFGDVVSRCGEVRLELAGGAGMLPFSLHVALSRDPAVRDLARFYGRTIPEKIRRQILQSRSSYLNELRARIPAHVAPRVSFRGAVPHRALVDRYREADMLVFPSIWNEPFGMPLAEAMACGLPVVATRGGGIPEIVEEGVTGLLVNRGDAKGLADALVDLIERPDKRWKMGRAGRLRAERVFSWARAADTLAAHYDTLLSLQKCG